MSMRHVVICSMPGSKIFFHNILQTDGFLFKKVIEQILSETFLILRRNERDMIISEHGSSCKVPVILVRFSWKLNFLDMFSKSNQKANFMKIWQWEPSCCMQTDGRTDRHDEANSRFSQFYEMRVKVVAKYRGLTVLAQTPILCLNISTSKWPFSCRFQASRSHLSRLKLCYDTVQSGKAVWTTTPFKA